ncbi:MAG: aminoacetone oxidase family FAD-binding enzyme [Rhizobacter sp.]|nr:aminoacetone oxidase family FAD-binding enzyme [Chlorobiales bacterium]
MPDTSSDILITGGGAAGICAALGARHLARSRGLSDAAFRITLLERNPRLGIKIRISGGGKCNITHAGEMQAVLAEGFSQQGEQRFLKPAFFTLTNAEVLRWLHAKGVPTFARENGRVFPTSGKALDVLTAFEQCLDDHRIDVRTGVRAGNVRRTENGFEVSTAQGPFTAPFLILATGGVSYQKTGTTGDGLRFATSLGHTLAPLQAALAPVYFKSKPHNDLVGVSLRKVGLIVKSAQTQFRRVDDVLITHLGISGPACLSISREVAAAAAMKLPQQVLIDFFPATNEHVLDAELIGRSKSTPQQFVRTFFESVFPASLSRFVFEAAGVSITQLWRALTKDERKRLLQTVKAFPLGDVGGVPVDKGEVSAGGVNLKEVNAKTMASRLVPHLYLAGEMLDIAGEVGGFNLQAAYSTGWVAGIHAASQAIE